MKHKTPPCPKGIYEYRCEYCGIDLVCHLEYFPAEHGSVDSYGAPYEPSRNESLDLISVYIAGTDVEISPIISAAFMDDMERFALMAYKDNTP